MKVFIIADEDTNECYVFQKRKNAIDTMYRKCKEWGADLQVAVKINNHYHYVSFNKIFDTDEQRLNFLYLSSNSELNEVFESYWYFQELKIEDED